MAFTLNDAKSEKFNQAAQRALGDAESSIKFAIKEHRSSTTIAVSEDVRPTVISTLRGRGFKVQEADPNRSRFAITISGW